MENIPKAKDDPRLFSVPRFKGGMPPLVLSIVSIINGGVAFKVGFYYPNAYNAMMTMTIGMGLTALLWFPLGSKWMQEWRLQSRFWWGSVWAAIFLVPSLLLAGYELRGLPEPTVRTVVKTVGIGSAEVAKSKERIEELQKEVADLKRTTGEPQRFTCVFPTTFTERDGTLKKAWAFEFGLLSGESKGFFLEIRIDGQYDSATSGFGEAGKRDGLNLVEPTMLLARQGADDRKSPTFRMIAENLIITPRKSFYVVLKGESLGKNALVYFWHDHDDERMMPKEEFMKLAFDSGPCPWEDESGEGMKDK